MNLRTAIVSLGILPAALFAPMPGLAGTYCCLTNGHRTCGDVLPAECYGRAYQESDGRGNTLRRVDAPMTAEQLARREAELQQKKEAERMAAEEERRNQALLNTYASEQDIEFMRNRALAEIEIVLRDARAKHDDAIIRGKKLDEELEFYKKKGPPPALKEQIKAIALEISTQKDAIQAKEKERQEIGVRFDEDKKRYLALKLSGKRLAPSASAVR